MVIEESDSFNISYVLMDDENLNNTIIVANDSNDELMQLKVKSYEATNLHDWDYSIDKNIFGELEMNKNIGYMDIFTHLAIWNEINECYPYDIEHKHGMQKYIDYCKKNNITKQIIDEKMNTNILDIMRYDKKNNVLRKYKVEFRAFDEYPYDVKILTSVDFGKNYVYTGNGRFCKDKEELNNYIKELNAKGIEKYSEPKYEKER